MNDARIHRTSKRYVVAQNLLLILFVAVVFFAPRDLLFESAAIRAIGNVLGLIGALFIVVAVVSLRRVIQIAPEPREGGKLVVSGLYKYLRHPIYTGMMFCLIGLFLRTPTIWIGFSSAAVIAFMFFKARFEEELLLIAYSDYASYRRRTWGLFPGLC
jgi:protein-S-isoprenylcysteine O-methyltransferase Ste14